MASPQSFPLVRGRSMRVTKTDGCCAPAYGPDNQVVTEGFVSVALTANVTDAEEITVVNANGKTCVRDPGCPEFNGYGVEITFCEVSPCLFSLVTGQPVVLDASGNIVGFRMNSKVSVCDTGFALEVWMGVPGVACSGDAGAYGYLLLPCLQGGVIGDFTIENAAVTFTVQGANTKDGNGWGTGPYKVVGTGGGSTPITPSVLPQPLDPDDHLLAIFTTVPPPAPTNGCVELLPADASAITADITLGLTGVGGAAEVGGGVDGGVRVVVNRDGTPIPQDDITWVNWGDGTIDDPADTTGGFIAHVYTAPQTGVTITVQTGGGESATTASFDVV